MNTKLILQNNTAQFLTDIKSVRNVLVIPKSTKSLFLVSKKEVFKEAESIRINYYTTDSVFMNKRITMVIT